LKFFILIKKKVFHVANIRKNLIFNSLLSKNNFKMLFENAKFILFKKGVFVEKGYMCDGLF
jgi:hypothetical protein